MIDCRRFVLITECRMKRCRARIMAVGGGMCRGNEDVCGWVGVVVIEVQCEKIVEVMNGRVMFLVAMILRKNWWS